MATTFKGIYSAFDFAYGINPNAGGALQVIGGSNAAGAYTVTCAPAKLSSADGLPIGLSTGTPITIGSAAGIETVTPTAVALDQLGHVLITATFAYAHGTGAQIRSGTFGLAEAVNYASTKGGVVAVDGDWEAAGGVNGTITGTKGFTNVPVLDARGTASGAAFSYKAAANGDDYAVTTISWV